MVGSAAAGSGCRLLAAALGNRGNVAKATQEHCRHARKQHSTDLKAGKVVHTANAHEHGDNGQNHAGGTADPTDP
jgi:hypothetical protein